MIKVLIIYILPAYLSLQFREHSPLLIPNSATIERVLLGDSLSEEKTETDLIPSVELDKNQKQLENKLFQDVGQNCPIQQNTRCQNCCLGNGKCGSLIACTQIKYFQIQRSIKTIFDIFFIAVCLFCFIFYMVHFVYFNNKSRAMKQ